MITWIRTAVVKWLGHKKPLLSRTGPTRLSNEEKDLYLKRLAAGDPLFDDSQ